MNYTGKTILSCYYSIDKVIVQIENVIKKKAKNSFYDSSSTEKQAEKILQLVEIRKDLFELKLICEMAFSKLSEYDKILISYKYFGIKPSDENFDLKSRNYFRKQIKALDNFNKILVKSGYDSEWFKNKYLKIAYIAGIYQKAILEEGKKHVIE